MHRGVSSTQRPCSWLLVVMAAYFSMRGMSSADGGLNNTCITGMLMFTQSMHFT
ncbi:hypothetical protein GDO81_008319 [Engystomops pustulosus]|uniref:Uncharacterized protein n=1 Tax=Engystomops pustulosus TaxID=76066 RepID=A0AAV7CDU6_ENGPU|nr:hypothetical protein GDO81_008319 [Engystomops pustulosus]